PIHSTLGTFLMQDDQDPDLDLNPDACTSKVIVTADRSRIWNASMNFSQAWSNAEQKATTPEHRYMQKQHSVAIYMYTQAVRRPGGTVLTAAEGPEKQLTSESQPLFAYLSEAIQILKHSQRLCHTTSYPSLNLNTSGKLLRFGTGNTCFQVHTCFGVDISHYSALEEDGQVLIPPYEVFKVTHVSSDPRRGEFTHKLESNLNCIQISRSSGPVQNPTITKSIVRA
uniref:NAD(P)(+)--arginine ADP-ribosyltransferase n=1 Tax=Takifugu rubripes TaxID=31033 RepID=A0A3B5KQ02_TAKRU